MDRESYLRSLPYLHPSSWPSPSASRAYGGLYVRKLIFSGHFASIEPSSSQQPGTLLGPAFFLTDTSALLAATAAVTEGGAHIPAIEDDPALCPFEASVLVPKSIAGVSPGASSASTAFASSQSPVGTTPAAAAAVGKATPAATSASSAMAATSTVGLSDTPKQSDAQLAPEPILYFRFGGNGTYCVNFSHIQSITVEKGSNSVANKKAAEAEGSQGDEAGSQGVDIPPSVVISFGTCSFRIFRLATPSSDAGSMDEDTNEEQLKNLRLTVSELTASLRAAGSFVPPPSPSTDKEASGDTQLSDRASLEEGGQIDGGIGLESSGGTGTCSEGKGQSQATDGDTNTVQMSENAKSRSQASQQSLTTEEDTQQRSACAKEDGDNDNEAVSKRRRIAYKQSVAAIDSIGAIADPISSKVDTGARRRVGSGAVAQKQLSSLMKVAATALAVSYEEASTGTESSPEDRVDKIATILDEAVCEFIPIHTRVKQQRGGVLSSLSMSSPPPTKRPCSVESTASAAAAGTTGNDDDSARDGDELRGIARKMIDEFREAIAAKHRSEILPSR